MAMQYAASHAVWIKQLLTEIGCEHYVDKPIDLYGDNKAALQLTMKDFITTGNQYIYQPYHWIKELCKEGYINPLYKHTLANIADLFTKAVPSQYIARLVPQLVGNDLSWNNPD